MNKKLCKTNEGKMLGGVCAGFAKYFNVDPTVIRIIWVIFCLGYGSGILLYLICYIIMPNEDIEYIKKK